VRPLLIATAVLLGFSLGANWFLERTIKKLEETVQGQQFLIDGLAEREAKLRSEIAGILNKRRKDGMDAMLLNGKPRCTLIQKFDGEIVVVGPGAVDKLRFRNLEEAGAEVEKRGWVISIIHPTLQNQEV
jgi:hypothetical protein